MTRCINDAGLELIKKYEGCVLTPYQNAGDVPTVGYGHTHGVTMDMGGITQDQADAFLLADIEEFEQFVEDNVTVDLTDNQFSALVSLCYNVGYSPIIRGNLGKLLNAGNYSAAADHFLLYDMAAGEHSNGLENRRIAEKNLFLTVD